MKSFIVIRILNRSNDSSLLWLFLIVSYNWGSRDEVILRYLSLFDDKFLSVESLFQMNLQKLFLNYARFEGLSNDLLFWLEELRAGRNGLGSLIIFAGKLKHIVLDLLFLGFVMFSVNGDPGHILMWWVQSISGLGSLVLEFISSAAIEARLDILEVWSELFRARLSNWSPSNGRSIILFHTDNNVEIVWSRSKVQDTNFPQVSDALSFTMLAGENPLSSLLFLMSVSVWENIVITDLRESWSINSLFKCSNQKVLTVWTKWLVI